MTTPTTLVTVGHYNQQDISGHQVTGRRSITYLCWLMASPIRGSSDTQEQVDVHEGADSYEK